MITSFGLVIIIIILHELRRITGRFRVRHGAGISVGTVVFRALGVKLLTHFVTCICIVSGIEVTVCCTAANVVHCGSYRCLDTCVVGSRIDSKTTPTTNANDADSFGIHIRTCREVIHRRREVFGVDVWRSYAARLSTAFTGKRRIKSNRQESSFGQCLGIQPRRLFLYSSKRTADSNSRQLTSENRFRCIQVGSERDTVTIYESHFAMIHLVAFRVRLVPFLCQI